MGERNTQQSPPTGAHNNRLAQSPQQSSSGQHLRQTQATGRNVPTPDAVVRFYQSEMQELMILLSKVQSGCREVIYKLQHDISLLQGMNTMHEQTITTLERTNATNQNEHDEIVEALEKKTTTLEAANNLLVAENRALRSRAPFQINKVPQAISCTGKRTRSPSLEDTQHQLAGSSGAAHHHTTASESTHHSAESSGIPDNSERDPKRIKTSTSTESQLNEMWAEMKRFKAWQASQAFNDTQDSREVKPSAPNSKPSPPATSNDRTVVDFINDAPGPAFVGTGRGSSYTECEETNSGGGISVPAAEQTTYEVPSQDHDGYGPMPHGSAGRGRDRGSRGIGRGGRGRGAGGWRGNGHAGGGEDEGGNVGGGGDEGGGRNGKREER